MYRTVNQKLGQIKRKITLEYKKKQRKQNKIFLEFIGKDKLDWIDKIKDIK